MSEISEEKLQDLLNGMNSLMRKESRFRVSRKKTKVMSNSNENSEKINIKVSDNEKDEVQKLCLK